MKNIMKKILLILAVATLVFAFASCEILDDLMGKDTPDIDISDDNNNNDNNNNEENPPVEDEKPSEDEKEDDKPSDDKGDEKPEEDPAEKICDQLNSFNGNVYASIEFTVETTVNGEKLVSEFVLNSNNEISYRIEQLAKIEIDGNGNLVIPEERIVVSEGIAIVSDNNKVGVNVNGDFVELPEYEELVGGFSFNYGDFYNYNVGKNALGFDVRNADDFFGADVALKNVHAEVRYTADGFSSITVTADTANGSVVYTYAYGEIIG